MAVFRVQKTQNYTIMSNHHLRNKALSLKAKGLLSLMLSLPEDWDYTTRGLASICKEGVDSVCATVRELEAAGYIIRRRIRDKNGQMRGMEYTVLEQPQPPEQDKPSCAQPKQAEPKREKPVQENPAQLNTKEINKEETKLEAKEEVTFIKNEMVLIKMNNYNLENKFNILHSIMYLSNILASKSISDLDMWLDNDEQKVILKLSKDINREDYKNIEISLEQLEKYGIWVSLNVDLYRDIKEKIEIS